MPPLGFFVNAFHGAFSILHFFHLLFYWGFLLKRVFILFHFTNRFSSWEETDLVFYEVVCADHKNWPCSNFISMLISLQLKLFCKTHYFYRSIICRPCLTNFPQQGFPKDLLKLYIMVWYWINNWIRSICDRSICQHFTRFHQLIKINISHSPYLVPGLTWYHRLKSD